MRPFSTFFILHVKFSVICIEEFWQFYKISGISFYNLILFFYANIFLFIICLYSVLTFSPPPFLAVFRKCIIMQYTLHNSSNCIVLFQWGVGTYRKKCLELKAFDSESVMLYTLLMCPFWKQKCKELLSIPIYVLLHLPVLLFYVPVFCFCNSSIVLFTVWLQSSVCRMCMS